ncbi:uncharacterized protein N7459_006182 [Penicillium hispanicum]|uniref:uncharacterized protein n=1 Tax=Penicillium hispanicum TaxID=1080232 RepID=UPI00253F7BF9|nr:uncharacterized protein N7459_006182 [Penicillium hispanicum]KAJ5580197.1 hypothetical protein N7459_006182 [Penicillium hispanicum]
MAPIDQYWNSFSGIDPESNRAKRVRGLLQNADFDHLCSQAVQLRLGKEEGLKSLFCTVDKTKFTSGACNVVIALSFSDGIQWIARIQLPLDDGSDDESVATSLLSEVSTMELIRARTTIPVPSVFGYDVSTRNIGYRYILMEALSGRPLNGRIALSVPDAYKDKFATQLAHCLYELSTIRFGQIERLLYSASGNSTCSKSTTVIAPVSQRKKLSSLWSKYSAP